MMEEIITSDMIGALCPERKHDGHKGTFGTALIIAGSRLMPGAQTLAAGTALRSGVGMVRVFAPSGSLDSTRANYPCALFSEWEETETSTIRLLSFYMRKAGACLIGPGLDESDKRSLAVLEYVIGNAPLLVIDAGAINLLASNIERLMPLLKERAKGTTVITPHPGEFARLKGTGNGSGFAKETGCIVVLKGHRTTVSSPDGRCCVNDGDNDGMAKGGSGDVLAGLITGLLAQGMDPFDAAVSGVFLHSVCGRILRDRMGARAMLPQDMPSVIGDAFRKAGWEK